jgi:hypothetical protein
VKKVQARTAINYGTITAGKGILYDVICKIEVMCSQRTFQRVDGGNAAGDNIICQCHQQF